MKLLHLTATSVRGVPDGTYTFTDARTGTPLPVVLITGGPGTGKTSLLDAIAAAKEAIGSYGAPPDARRLVRRGARASRIVTTWLLSDTEREHARLADAHQTVTWDSGPGGARVDAELGLRRMFADFSRSKLEYFPSNRALPSVVRTAFGRPNRDAETHARATRAPDKYACILDGLHALTLEGASLVARTLREQRPPIDAVPDVLGPYKEAVAALLPNLRLVGIDLAGGGGLQFTCSTHETFGLAELSDSELQGVLFALVFPYFGLNRSLVLIDEPELHLHAAARVRFLEALIARGRDNQIIAATGSAELVNAAARGQVIDLERLAARSGAASAPRLVDHNGAVAASLVCEGAAPPRELEGTTAPATATSVDERTEPPPQPAEPTYEVPSYMQTTLPMVSPTSTPSLRPVISAEPPAPIPRLVAPVAAGRRHDETVPLTKAMLREALTRGPLPFRGHQAPVIRERRIPTDDAEDERTAELPPGPPGAPWSGRDPRGGTRGR